MIQGGREKVNKVGWLEKRDIGDDLVDGYVKALRRRAEQEKWVEAGREWEVFARDGGGGGMEKELGRRFYVVLGDVGG